MSGEGDVSRQVGSDEVTHACGVKDGGACAGGPAAACKGDDGDALPESFGSGCAAVVREGIERDIDAVVGGEKGIVIFRAFQNQTFGGDA